MVRRDRVFHWPEVQAKVTASKSDDGARRSVRRGRAIGQVWLPDSRDPSKAALEPALECIHVRVKHGSEVQRDELRENQTAANRNTQCPSGIRSRARA